MGDIGAHFSRSEFKCHCGECGFDVVDIELITCLEAVRDYFQAPIKVLSGCRCAAHNAAIGGSPKSQHMLGKAADIAISGVHPNEVYDYLDRICFDEHGGLGQYKTFTHLDVRAVKARWDYRQKSGD